ncbi:MAG: phosphatase PAP2-related protein [bacterium]
MQKVPEFIKNWKNELENKKFKANVFITIIFLAVVLFSVTKFLSYNELRFGFSFRDPILSSFKPINVTWFTFIIMYGAIPITLISLAKSPRVFILGFQAYTIMLIFRVFCMFMLPLNPPIEIITLTDPFIAFFATGITFKKDLFFSGHTATMFLMFLCLNKGPLKIILFICTLLIGLLVLVQHVHYSIDVFAAPFFAYVSFIIAKKINDMV